MIRSVTFHPFLSLTPEEQIRRIETDRITAQRSTYWGCCCGLDHVANCKVRRTEWVVKVIAGCLIGSAVYWKWGI